MTATAITHQFNLPGISPEAGLSCVTHVQARINQDHASFPQISKFSTSSYQGTQEKVKNGEHQRVRSNPDIFVALVPLGKVSQSLKLK